MKPNQASPDKVWSRRRFWGVLGFVFILQVAWIFVFGRPVAAPSENDSPSTSFRMVAGKLPRGAFESLLVTDPTLFVLPGSDSFSGPAWLNVKEMDFSPAEWSESPRWLKLRKDTLTGTFSRHVKDNRNPLMQTTEKLPPYEPEPTLPIFAATNRSRIKLDETIEKRLASSVPTLNSWQHTEPLDRSIVEMGVDGAGRVVTVRLLHRSGSGAADQAALRMASAMAFAPLDSEALTVGKVHFIWQTEPVSATNGTATTTTEVR